MSILGGWRPSLLEKRRLPKSTFLLLALIAVVASLNMVFSESSTATPPMWLYPVVGSVLTGFNEKVIARGQRLVALRSKFGETGVWFIFTLLFFLLNLPNTFFGIGALAILQVLIQFGLGSVYYVASRFNCCLVPAMIVHGL
ncbi:CPBP family glutamic-type intramembrane protease [Rhodoglobus sp.]